jgi:hypothetical protein
MDSVDEERLSSHRVPQHDEGIHYWEYCVNCGTLLEGRKCKLICPKCGFYHSCSEP